MKLSFEKTLVEVWRQTLVETAKTVELDSERFPVRGTAKKGLRQVDFVFDGEEIRGLEQNPQTKSRWAQMARSGKKVMQFLSEGRYMAKCRGWEGDGLRRARRNMTTVPDLEEYTVFDIALSHDNYAGDKVEQIVIMDSTETSVIFGRWLNTFSEKAPEVPPKMLDDLQVQWKQGSLIENRFSLPKRVSMVSKSETESLFSPKDKLGWARFRERFPNSSGIVTLSRVIFEGDRKHALVYVGNQKDWLSGSGIVFFLAKNDAGWKVQTSRIVWLS